jgi:hypothetical protein
MAVTLPVLESNRRVSRLQLLRGILSGLMRDPSTSSVEIQLAVTERLQAESVAVRSGLNQPTA